MGRVDRPGLSQGGGHVVTVDDLLAEEDARQAAEVVGRASVVLHLLPARSARGDLEEPFDGIAHQGGQLARVAFRNVGDELGGVGREGLLLTVRYR